MTRVQIRTNHSKQPSHWPSASGHYCATHFSYPRSDRQLYGQNISDTLDRTFPASTARPLFYDHALDGPGQLLPDHEFIHSYSAPPRQKTTKYNRTDKFEAASSDSLIQDRDLSFDEEDTVLSFTEHAQFCELCTDPLETFLAGLELCEAGLALARKIASVLFMTRKSEIRSRFDGQKVAIGFGFESARSLLKSIEQSLRIPGRPFVIHERHDISSISAKQSDMQQQCSQLSQQHSSSSLATNFGAEPVGDQLNGVKSAANGSVLSVPTKKVNDRKRRKKIHRSAKGVAEVVKKSALPATSKSLKSNLLVGVDAPDIVHDDSTKSVITGSLGNLPVKLSLPGQDAAKECLCHNKPNRPFATYEDYDGDSEDNGKRRRLQRASSKQVASYGMRKRHRISSIEDRTAEGHDFRIEDSEPLPGDTFIFDSCDEGYADAVHVPTEPIGWVLKTHCVRFKKPPDDGVVEHAESGGTHNRGSCKRAPKRQRESQFSSSLSHPKGKRARGGGRDPDDEGHSSDQDDDEDDRQPRKNGRAIPFRLRRRFKCPFYQRHPEKYKRAACRGEGFADISKLKDHIKRVHTQPLRCSRCWLDMDSEEAYSAHLQSDNECEKLPKPHDDRILPYVLQRLDFKKAPYAQANDTEKWRKLYSVLFPDDKEVPSPYHEQYIPPNLGQALSKALEEELATENFAHVPKQVLQLLHERIPDIIASCKANLGDLQDEETEPKLNGSDRGATTNGIDGAETPRIRPATNYASEILASRPGDMPFGSTRKKSRQVRFSPSRSTPEDLLNSCHTSSLESSFDTPYQQTRHDRFRQGCNTSDCYDPCSSSQMTPIASSALDGIIEGGNCALDLRTSPMIAGMSSSCMSPLSTTCIEPGFPAQLPRFEMNEGLRYSDVLRENLPSETNGIAAGASNSTALNGFDPLPPLQFDESDLWYSSFDFDKLI